MSLVALVPKIDANISCILHCLEDTAGILISLAPAPRLGQTRRESGEGRGSSMARIDVQ